MANLLFSTGIQVESIMFPPNVKPPGATNTLYLGGAGVRGVEIQSKFVKVSVIGVYLEDRAIHSLAVKWKGKSANELQDSEEFFKDIVIGPFENFIQVTAIVSLTGKQFSEKVSAHCVAIWKANECYTDKDAIAIDKFIEVFKDKYFPPGSSILLMVSPAGSLTISFSKDGCVPETLNIVLENTKLGHAIMDMVIGKHGVSPEAKKSLASSFSSIT